MNVEELDTTPFCVNLWKGLHVGTLGEIKPCCFWEKEIGNLNKNSLEEIWNCEEMQKARQEVLKGNRIPQCKDCYNQEARGQSSTRIGNNRRVLRRLKGFTPEKVESLEPWIVDLRISNICNLKCKTCNPVSSSTWESFKPLSGEVRVNSKENRQKLKQLILQSARLSEIYFAGGEPSLIVEDWEILEELIRRQQTGVKLRYNTNLLKIEFPGKGNLVDLWKQWIDLGGDLQLGISVDAYGDLDEFIREKTKWTDLDTNLKYLVDKCIHSRILIEFTPVISIFNVLGILDLIDYAEELGIGSQAVCFHNILQGPSACDIRILPKHIKDRILTLLDQRIQKETRNRVKADKERYYNIIQQVFQEEKEYKLCSADIATFFPERFNELVPELANWWKEKIK